MRLALERRIAALLAKTGQNRWLTVGLGLGIVMVVILIPALLTNGAGVERSSQPPSDLLSTASLMTGVLFKLGIVLLLIYSGVALLRRYQAAQTGRAVQRLRVVETTHLSPRQKLHLVQVGERTLLIGATDHGLSYLTEVTPHSAEVVPHHGQPLPENGERATPAKLNFGALLAEHSARIHAKE